MEPIHVKRYKTPGVWAGTIEPEDRSWIVFIASDGEASFWRRTDMRTSEGKFEYAYIDAELPMGVARVVGDQNFSEALEPDLPEPVTKPWPGPIDFEVKPADGEGATGFVALLNCRAVACGGETEHEAIRNLMNYVAQLCVAGCMDHTGAPVPGHNPRRYDFVFPDSGVSKMPPARCPSP